MKWFKHMTASSDDEKMADLINGGGVDGLAMYGAYWRIAEIIAAQMEGKTPSCAVSYPVWKWTQLLFTRKSHLCSVLTRLKKTGLLVVEGDPNVDSHVICKMPNLLKYRDEYSKKSGHAPDNIPPRTEGEGEGEGEQRQKEKKPNASTANAVPADKGKLLGTLPLVDGTDWDVYSIFADELQGLYLAVDVRQELRSMKGWLIGNPTNRKTKRGISRFITSWLEREQNKSGKNGGNTNGKPSFETNIAAKQTVLDARAAGRMARGADDGGGGNQARFPGAPADSGGRTLDLVLEHPRGSGAGAV